MIQVRNLTKTYGKKVAVDGVSFDVAQGDVCALVGPRGAGKSSVMRILATLLKPTGGDATIAGASVARQPDVARSYIGYLPEDFGVYADTTVEEYLIFFADCYGVPAHERATLAADLMQLVDLSRKRNAQLDTLTHGMRQRLGIARMLVGDPPVLLLDEPTLGMDPRAQVETRELLRELATMNKTILIAGRNLAEAQNLANKVVVLDGGKVARAGLLDELLAEHVLQRAVTIRFMGEAERAMDIARASEGVFAVDLIGAPAPTPAVVADDSATKLAGENKLAAAPQIAPQAAPQPLIKEMRCSFSGGYDEANTLLQHLLRAGVQVVAFGES